MADRTSIEWTDATLNPIRARNRATGQVGWYCEHASPGCKNCYAEGFNANRLGTRLPFKPGHRDDVEHFLDEAILLQPLRWRRPRRIFLGSMTDLFGDWVPVAWLDQIFAVAALSPHHTFQVLTKRSARMRAYLSDPIVRARIAMAMARITARGTLPGMERGRQIVKRMEGDGWPLPNVWAGVSAEDQERANARLWDLRQTPAVVHFVSAEPLLSGIDFAALACPTGCRSPEYCNYCYLDGKAATGTWDALAGGWLDQIIVGGESGPGARPTSADWVRPILEQCRAASVAFFFKQWGDWLDHETALDVLGDDDPRVSDSRRRTRAGQDGLTVIGDVTFIRVGKKAAGRLLDGVQHDGMPEVRCG